jgi:rod shape-determining protein MreC
MPLGTLDRTPPPFFRQGPSALTRLLFFASLALFLMAADTRLKVTAPLRSAAALVLNPVESLLHAPVAAWDQASLYLEGLAAARAAEARARESLAEQAQRVAQTSVLEQENTRLRALLELRPRIGVHSVAAELLYDAADAYSRKVIIDSGQNQGVRQGAPVVNEDGVLGQVTRVYSRTAEVTLLIDREAAIPVVNQRTQHRSVAFGQANTGSMELRFIATNADVQSGDLLTTSGLDGVFPAGLQVARVEQVDRRADQQFAKIVLSPVAGREGVRHVLVLEPVGLQMPPRPPPEPAPAGKRGERPARRGTEP